MFFFLARGPTRIQGGKKRPPTKKAPKEPKGCFGSLLVLGLCNPIFYPIIRKIRGDNRARAPPRPGQTTLALFLPREGSTGEKKPKNPQIFKTSPFDKKKGV